MTDWNSELDAAVQRVAGPEDEPDEEVNGDPTSMLGEDDESGFDEMAEWPDWQAVLDDAYDDAEGGDDDGEDEEEEE